MSREDVEGTIDTLELLMLQRYNMRAPDDSEPFAAIRGLRKGQDATSLARVTEVLGARELYRWTDPVKGCLRALRGELDEAAAEAERRAEEEAIAEAERVEALRAAEEARVAAEKAEAERIAALPAPASAPAPEKTTRKTAAKPEEPATPD